MDKLKMLIHVKVVTPDIDQFLETTEISISALPHLPREIYNMVQIVDFRGYVQITHNVRNLRNIQVFDATSYRNGDASILNIIVSLPSIKLAKYGYFKVGYNICARMAKPNKSVYIHNSIIHDGYQYITFKS